jgi:hypothetical protein
MANMYDASIAGRIRDFHQGIARIEASLKTLQHQSSTYADDHRALITVYRDVLSVLTKAERDTPHAVDFQP